VPTIRLDLGDPQQHLLAISIELEAPGPHLVLNLPAWTPGSYLIRDYVRHLEGLEVQCGGKPCQLRRLGPASWQVDLAGTVGEPVQIGYRLLATDLSVRTCHLDADHGFFALAAVVLEVEGQRLVAPPARDRPSARLACLRAPARGRPRGLAGP
jgi:predicted metalloprotease with PDZ domain